MGKASIAQIGVFAASCEFRLLHGYAQDWQLRRIIRIELFQIFGGTFRSLRICVWKMNITVY